MTDRFQDPTQPGSFDPKAWIGHLVLIEGQRFLENVPTRYGPSDAVESRVTVLTAPTGPEVIEGARLFGGLTTSARASIGALPVLGRLASYLAQSGNQGIRLESASPEDRQYAEHYLNTRPSPAIAAPPAAPPVASGYPTPQVPTPGYPPQQPAAQPYAGTYAAPAQQAPPAPPYAPPQAPAGPPAPVPAQAPYPTPQQGAQPPAYPPAVAPPAAPAPMPGSTPGAPQGQLTPAQLAALPPEVAAMLAGAQPPQAPPTA
jgi:hypothetical protein